MKAKILFFIFGTLCFLNAFSQTSSVQLWGNTYPIVTQYEIAESQLKWQNVKPYVENYCKEQKPKLNKSSLIKELEKVSRKLLSNIEADLFEISLKEKITDEEIYEKLKYGEYAKKFPKLHKRFLVYLGILHLLDCLYSLE